jgi:hypothetical protein
MQSIIWKLVQYIILHLQFCIFSYYTKIRILRTHYLCLTQKLIDCAAYLHNEECSDLLRNKEKLVKLRKNSKFKLHYIIVIRRESSKKNIKVSSKNGEFTSERVGIRMHVYPHTQRQYRSLNSGPWALALESHSQPKNIFLIHKVYTQSHESNYWWSIALSSIIYK